MLHVDTLQSIVDALVYLQYYLHKVTKQQNNSKANINNTLSALTTYSDLAWDDLITLQVWVDKENSIEFLLDSVYYLYNYYMVCVLLSHTHHMTPSCDVTLWHSDMWL